jgi:CHAD domain-containing protein
MARVRRRSVADDDASAQIAAGGASIGEALGSGSGPVWRGRERVEGVYRDARKAMPGVRERNDALALHRWRRRVKALWYDLRLFEERMPLVKPLAEDLERLEGWLGEDHNLVLLRHQISSMSQQPPSDLARLTALAGSRQEELRRASLS